MRSPKRYVKHYVRPDVMLDRFEALIIIHSLTHRFTLSPPPAGKLPRGRIRV